MKWKILPEELCQGLIAKFALFIEEVNSYKYETTPDYKKLAHLMTSVLLDYDIVPDPHLDWSTWQRKKTEAVVDYQCRS